MPLPRICRILQSLIVGSVLAASSTLWSAPADFTVESVPAGKTFRLSEARGQFVVLHFLLKTECPICLRHVREHARQSPNLPGVIQVFLKPDSSEEILRWTGRLKTSTKDSITVYRDPDATLARAYEIPDGYTFHGEQVHFPALLILDPDGREVFRKVGKDNTDRVSPSQLATALKELMKDR